MKKDLELWEFAAKRLETKQSVTLLVVAESVGSSPGRQGFKMIVAQDKLCGSIGGGIMEVRLVELAKGKGQKEKGKNKSKIQNPKSKIQNRAGSSEKFAGQQRNDLFGQTIRYLFQT